MRERSYAWTLKCNSENRPFFFQKMRKTTIVVVRERSYTWRKRKNRRCRGRKRENKYFLHAR